MEWKIAKLKEVNFALDDNYISSETLYCALANAAFSLQRDNLITKAFFENENPLVLSSAFPFFKDNFYLPVVDPFLIFSKTLSNPKVTYETKKEIKKKKYFKMSVISNPPSSYKELLYDQFDNAIFSNEEIHTAIDRTTLSAKEGQLFVKTSFYSIDDAGLYFYFDAEHEYLVRECLEFLERTGIGGDKSAGKGKFIFEIEKAPWQGLKSDKEYCLSLGFFSPSLEEMEIIQQKKEKARYQLVRWSGFSEKERLPAARKPEKFYFAEGSIFPGFGKDFAGERKKFRNLNKTIYWNGITPLLYFEVEK